MCFIFLLWLEPQTIEGVFMYNIVKNRPVASFRYKGTHSKPVRRVVLVTESDRNHITGYEIQEGNTTRERADAPIKTFTREKIAKDATGNCTLRRSALSKLEA